MLFYLGLILTIVGLLFVSIQTVKKRNILSPQMFLFGGILIFLFLPAIVLESKYIKEPGYNAAILLGVIGCYIASCSFPYNILDQNKREEFYTPKIYVFRTGAYIYALYLLYQILSTILLHGSIAAVFATNRIDNYLGENIISASPIHRALSEGLKIFFYFYIAYLFSNRKYVEGIFLYAVPMIHHRFTAVTRYDFVAMAGALVIYFLDSRLYKKTKIISDIDNKISNRKKKVKLLKLILIGVACIYFTLIFMRVSNFTRYGKKAVGLDISFIKLLKTTISNDSLYYEYFHHLYTSIQKGVVGYEFGKSWLVYPFINFIPRSLWFNKPYTAFSARMTDQVYWKLTSGNPVVTFSIFGEGYAQFGFLGCLICPFIFLGSRWLNFRELKKMQYNRLYILIVMFSLLTYMRSEAPMFYVLLDFAWLMIIQKFFMKNRRRKND